MREVAINWNKDASAGYKEKPVMVKVIKLNWGWPHNEISQHPQHLWVSPVRCLRIVYDQFVQIYPNLILPYKIKVFLALDFLISRAWDFCRVVLPRKTEAKKSQSTSTFSVFSVARALLHWALGPHFPKFFWQLTYLLIPFLLHFISLAVGFGFSHSNIQ